MLKKINFQKVYMENFCGYTSPMDFEFQNNKLTLITGENGIGKSTIFAAIPFACFGVTQSGQKTGDVVNNKTGKNCKVVCYLNVDENGITTNYQVERYVKYSKIGSTAILYENGEEIARGYTEVTNKMQHILVPKELFFNTILFGQNVKDFFTDLPDSKQKEIFRKILQLDMYTVYRENASKTVKQLEDDIEQASYEIEKISSNKLIYKNQIIEIKNKIEEIKQQIDKLHNDIKNVDVACDTTKNQIEQYSHIDDKIDGLKKNLDSLNRDNDLLNQQLANELMELQNSIDKKQSDLNNKCSDLKQKIMTELQNKSDEIHTQINALNQQLNNIQLTISKEFDKEIEKINEEMEHARQNSAVEIDDLVKKFNQTVKEKGDAEYQLLLERRNKVISDAHLKINEITNSISQTKLKIQDAETKIQQFQKQIDNQDNGAICPTCQRPLDDCSILEKSVIDLGKQIGDWQNELQELLTQLDLKKSESENEIAQIDNQIEILKQDIDKQTAEYENNINLLKTKNEQLIYNLQQKIIELKQNKQEKIDSESYKIKQNIASLNNRLNAIKQESMENLTQAQKRLDKAVDILRQKSAELKSQIELKYQDKRSDVLEKLTQCQKEIDEQNEKLKIRNSLVEKIQHLENVRNQIVAKIDDSKKLIKQNDDSIKNILKTIKELDKNIDNIVASNSTKYKLIDIYKFWTTGFSAAGIQSMLIDEAIPFMNRTITDYLEKLSGGRYKVSFDTMKQTKSGDFKDKISVNVYDTITHSNSRNGFSGGQIRLIDIATILTLCDLQENIQGFRTNILLFDEIFDALDDQNIVNVSNMLRRILSEDRSINIITHRHIDQVEADQIFNL